MYYPGGNPERDLFVNRKYPRKLWRTSPRRAMAARSHKNEDLIAPRVCGLNCIVINAVTGHKCRRPTCQDYRYCTRHLASIKHLLIAKSKRLHDLGVDGLGLYAYNPKFGRAHSYAKGIPIMDPTHIVFKTGDVLGEYGGEILTKAEFDSRYDDRDNDETATYAESGYKGFLVDGLGATSAISYSNESLDIGKLMRHSRDQNDFVQRYDTAAEYDHRTNVMTRQRKGMIEMVATRSIAHCEEILWNYTSSYWASEGMKRFITGLGW